MIIKVGFVLFFLFITWGILEHGKQWVFYSSEQAVLGSQGVAFSPLD